MRVLSVRVHMLAVLRIVTVVREMWQSAETLGRINRLAFRVKRRHNACSLSHLCMGGRGERGAAVVGSDGTQSSQPYLYLPIRRDMLSRHPAIEVSTMML